MKKIFLIPTLIFVFLLLNSCQKDDSLDPRPVLVSGSFVRLDITKKRLNFDDINNTSFGGMLTNPGGTVVTYNLYVRRTDGFTTSYGDFHLLKTVTSFPLDLSITPADIAAALGVDISVLKFSDVFRFYGEAFDANGNRADYYNLSPTIQSNQGFYKEAFRFGTDMTDTAGMDPLELNVFNNYLPQ